MTSLFFSSWETEKKKKQSTPMGCKAKATSIASWTVWVASIRCNSARNGSSPKRRALFVSMAVLQKLPIIRVSPDAVADLAACSLMRRRRA